MKRAAAIAAIAVGIFIGSCSVLLTEAQEPCEQTVLSTVFHTGRDFITVEGVLYSFPVTPQGTVLQDLEIDGVVYTGGIVEPDKVSLIEGKRVITRQVRLIAK